jgi:hypothetical protein
LIDPIFWFIFEYKLYFKAIFICSKWQAPDLAKEQAAAASAKLPRGTVAKDADD